MAIGESVMLGAGDELELGGFVVDVDEPRQGPETADLIEALAAAGEIGRTVVVQVGTNGPVTEDVYRRIAQALVGSEQVVFLTLHADRSWIGANNDIIRSLPAQYPNVSLLDWDELVASGAVSGIAADGIHLATSEAQQSYANAVFTAVGRDDLVRATRVSGLVVTVADDRPTVVDVRDANGLLGSFDLGCPTARTCTIESARVVGDTIWIAITDREGEGTTDDVGSRVVSAVTTSGEIVEHVRISGTTTIVRSAGLGANGILYAYVSDQAADRQLVAIEGGTVTTLATDVSGFLLSEDGRFLAVSFSNPPAGEQPRIEVTDLVDGTTNWFTTEGINAGPGAWSPDGRHLIVNDQWEDGTAWVVDPWSASARPTAAGEFLDGACFVDARTIAHRTWNVGYGQGDAQTGVIRLIDVDGGPPLAELGTDLFGDALGCHPDGSITYLQRPVVEVDLGGGLSTRARPRRTGRPRPHRAGRYVHHHHLRRTPHDLNHPAVLDRRRGPPPAAQNWEFSRSPHACVVRTFARQETPPMRARRAAEPSVFTTGWSALADGLSDAGAVMKAAGEELAAVAEPYVTEFATNAERDFEADPVGFLGTLGGAPRRSRCWRSWRSGRSRSTRSSSRPTSSTVDRSRHPAGEDAAIRGISRYRPAAPMRTVDLPPVIDRPVRGGVVERARSTGTSSRARWAAFGAAVAVSLGAGGGVGWFAPRRTHRRRRSSGSRAGCSTRVRHRTTWATGARRWQRGGTHPPGAGRTGTATSRRRRRRSPTT
ncbi:MAG: hypothetical protein R2713_05710 [Ilumatobacteraceae bacterium]